MKAACHHPVDNTLQIYTHLLLAESLIQIVIHLKRKVFVLWELTQRCDFENGILYVREPDHEDDKCLHHCSQRTVVIFLFAFGCKGLTRLSQASSPRTNSRPWSQICGQSEPTNLVLNFHAVLCQSSGFLIPFQTFHRPCSVDILLPATMVVKLDALYACLHAQGELVPEVQKTAKRKHNVVNVHLLFVQVVGSILKTLLLDLRTAQIGAKLRDKTGSKGRQEHAHVYASTHTSNWTQTLFEKESTKFESTWSFYEMATNALCWGFLLQHTIVHRCIHFGRRIQRSTPWRNMCAR